MFKDRHISNKKIHLTEDWDRSARIGPFKCSEFCLWTVFTWIQSLHLRKFKILLDFYFLKIFIHIWFFLIPLPKCCKGVPQFFETAYILCSWILFNAQTCAKVVGWLPKLFWTFFNWHSQNLLNCCLM